MNVVGRKTQVDLKTRYVTKWAGARSMLDARCARLIKRYAVAIYVCCVVSVLVADTNKTQGG
jgi:hypothetical protein